MSCCMDVCLNNLFANFIVTCGLMSDDDRLPTANTGKVWSLDSTDVVDVQDNVHVLYFFLSVQDAVTSTACHGGNVSPNYPVCY